MQIPRCFRSLPSIALWLSLAAVPALAEQPLEIIDLKSRSADELIPVLLPLAGPEATVSGRGYHLFIRAEPVRMAELRRIIDTLDRPPRQLLISVFQGSLTTQQRNALGIEHDDQPRAEVRRRSTRNALDATHRLRVSEGQPAFIATGRAYPQPYHYRDIGPDGASWRHGTEYREALSGFHVVPRLRDETVVLEIHPAAQRKRSDDGSFTFQRAGTVVEGRVGEWITIGSVTHADVETGSEILRRYSTRSRGESDILLKVELLHSGLNASPAAAAPGSPPASTE